MVKRNIQTLTSFNTDLKKSLENPKFRNEWKDKETEYILAKSLIERRLKSKLSQRQLAHKVKTTQAVISRIETMNANPSLSLLKRIAAVLGGKLILRFG